MQPALRIGFGKPVKERDDNGMQDKDK